MGQGIWAKKLEGRSSNYIKIGQQIEIGEYYSMFLEKMKIDCKQRNHWQKKNKRKRKTETKLVIKGGLT